MSVQPEKKDIPLLEINEFWAKVKKTGTCWEWIGGKSFNQYGRFIIPAHRMSYILLKGKIPDGLVLDHLCKNKTCVNPIHLEAVTFKENVLRGESPTAKYARRTHCNKGHPLSGDNLLMWEYTNGIARRCKTCSNQWKKLYKRRRKQ